MGDDENGRAQRELSELLEELRTILPGVQVLFAFLLTVPFTQRFTGVATPLIRDVYFATLVCTAISTVLLLAPPVRHRVLPPDFSRERRLRTATRLMLGGTGFLALAITGVLFIVTDVLFNTTAAAAVAAVAGCAVIALWYGQPLSRRLGR